MILRLLARGRTGRRTAIPARTVETPRRSSVNLFKGHTTSRRRRPRPGYGRPRRGSAGCSRTRTAPLRQAAARRQRAAPRRAPPRPRAPCRATGGWGRPRTSGARGQLDLAALDTQIERPDEREQRRPEGRGRVHRLDGGPAPGPRAHSPAAVSTAAVAAAIPPTAPAAAASTALRMVDVGLTPMTCARGRRKGARPKAVAVLLEREIKAREDAGGPPAERHGARGAPGSDVTDPRRLPRSRTGRVEARPRSEAAPGPQHAPESGGATSRSR